MSTPCAILVKTEDGYLSSYCHWDGYTSYMYPLLRDWYGTQERAEALVNFGDASYIAKRLVPSQDSNHSFEYPEEDVCVFYHRDRGEDWLMNEPYYVNKEPRLHQFHYAYVFEYDHWTAYEWAKKVEVAL